MTLCATATTVISLVKKGLVFPSSARMLKATLPSFGPDSCPPFVMTGPLYQQVQKVRNGQWLVFPSEKRGNIMLGVSQSRSMDQQTGWSSLLFYECSLSTINPLAIFIYNTHQHLPTLLVSSVDHCSPHLGMI